MRRRSVRPGLDALRRLAFQMVSALAYLSDCGIVHRCLCAANVMLDHTVRAGGPLLPPSWTVPSQLMLDGGASQGAVKLANYGLYYMTNAGTEVDFPIGSAAPPPPSSLRRDE